MEFCKEMVVAVKERVEVGFQFFSLSSWMKRNATV
jgi:hypothetical protein